MIDSELLCCTLFLVTIRAIVHTAQEGGFWAEVPALPGCVTQGGTVEEVRRNLHEAVELWLESGPSVEALASDDQILEFAV